MHPHPHDGLHMILRLSAKLSQKMHVSPAKSLPADENPFADWSAHLFTADRTQFVLVCNTASLYSLVFYGKGITNDHHLISRMTTQLGEHLRDDGLAFIFERLIAPSTSRVSFSKPLNRSVIGSMNELINYAKAMLENGEMAPYDLAPKLNNFLLSYLKDVMPDGGYARPLQAFRRLTPSQATASTE